MNQPARYRREAGAVIRRSALLGADYYEADDAAPAAGNAPKLGIGRDVRLERVIVDKNARIGDGACLVNEARIEHADGDGYYIRDGVIIHVFYPVFPPDRSATEVLSWLETSAA